HSLSRRTLCAIAPRPARRRVARPPLPPPFPYTTLFRSSPLSDNQALYVAAGEAEYLLWNNLRLRIPDRSAAVALALPPRPIPVEETLLNTVTAGPDLAPPAVPGAGEDSGLVLGGEPALIGQVFEVGGEHYQLTRDGLARIGDVTWTLLAADGVTATAIPARDRKSGVE